MKKFLTILSFLTTLSSSLVVVACKTDKTDQKINEHNKIDNKENDSNSNPKELEKPNNNLNMSEQDLPKDQPNNKEEKNEKIDEFAGEIKKEIEELLNKKEKSKILDYASSLISKFLQSSSQKQLLEELNNLESEISKLFDESKIEDIKAKIALLFSESLDNSTNGNEAQKLKQLLDKVTKENKELILETTRDLLGKKISNEFDQELKTRINEVNSLLEKKDYNGVKTKLFDIVDKSAKLEKNKI
ncbi:lipoprotein [Mycoplasma feriruminatoris]|uniref:Lipoprotein n=1 Tax=Mycoplasma feriruminatoris TaxID=1179777 RepID=A0A654IPY9_9MOLU|nr:hypothetical protein MF5583_00494 [Mycoplasma feriruminatoris]